MSMRTRTIGTMRGAMARLKPAVSAAPSYFCVAALAAAPRAAFAAPRPRTSAERRGLASANRPFRVLGLQQVAVGGETKDDMRKIWQVCHPLLGTAPTRAVLASTAAAGLAARRVAAGGRGIQNFRVSRACARCVPPYGHLANRLRGILSRLDPSSRFLCFPRDAK